MHAPDLVLRDWNPTQPDRLWVADMTQIATWQGWLHLSVIMDAYSRRVVGWSLAQHMRTELVQDALDMAVSRRKPDAGLVHHTDHGSQYTALTFGHQLRKHGIEPSMGRVKTCYDNAVAESFFATLKKELITAAPGPPETTPKPPWLTTSRSGTTTSACTAPWDTDHHPNTNRSQEQNPKNKPSANEDSFHFVEQWISAGACGGEREGSCLWFSASQYVNRQSHRSALIVGHRQTAGDAVDISDR